jgi:uncharacterized protein YneF (UPF0154 family)
VRSGGQKDNKNALKHGYSTIGIKTFKKEIREMLNQIKKQFTYPKR